MSGTITRIFGDSIINAKTSKEDFDIIKHSGKEVRYKAEGKHIFEEWGGGGGGDENAVLKKFLVHFRRSSNYKGEFGFDWMRDEYIYPLVNVTNDNDGTPINTLKPLCKDITKLKREYLKDVKNPITPYGLAYYPAWLSIFPHTTDEQFKYGSTMHAQGVHLNLEFNETDADPIVDDGTEILLESSNSFLKITPNKFSISEVLSQKKESKTINGIKINYRTLSKKVNIKCTGGALSEHEQIRVFAKLNKQEEEIGKLMVYKNNVIPKAEIVVVNVITSSTKSTLKDDYQILFKNHSFNQALIRAEVKVDTTFDINALPQNDVDVIHFKTNYVNASSNIGTGLEHSFKMDLIKLYEKFGKHSPNQGMIDGNTNKRTYLFYTTIIAQNTFFDGRWERVEGSCSFQQNPTSVIWGNAYVVFGTGLKDRMTILHEGGHSFSLPHTFEEGVYAGPHTFYQGFTDNIMDYFNQVGVSTKNPFEANDKTNCFFKWQWDIMRTDKSLIFKY